ncbi:hypothetical protein ACFVHB_17350 [Kitasatospora sp. NPDC127111]|uniref:hypothetical protein n=1 Tax=Kitasatospora sp. NPDC127111 TaxID=3345363 RepID=UPI003636D7A3
MTQPGSKSEDDDETFEVHAEPESAEQRPEYEGVNVCRVAALSTMFGGDSQAVGALSDELGSIGFSQALYSGESVWRGSTEGDFSPNIGTLRLDGSRVWLWQYLNETAHPVAATTFLVSVLGSELERESTAAAAALWRKTAEVGSRRMNTSGLLPGLPIPDDLARWALSGLVDFDQDTTEAAVIPWDPQRWRQIYDLGMRQFPASGTQIVAIALLAQWRLSLALRSPDPTTRSLAMAAFFPTEQASSAEPLPPVAPGANAPAITSLVSTMIHGTWGWKGDWWFPGQGGFHKFILDKHRPNLYQRAGTAFGWSGAYRPSQRKLAAARFHEWATEVAPMGLQTIFGHSYGSEIAARTAMVGTKVSQLVLLSSPVTPQVDAVAATNLPVVDVRLPFDPILGLARSRQRLTPLPNITQVLLSKWRLDHGATHKEAVWEHENVAQRGGI